MPKQMCMDSRHVQQPSRERKATNYSFAQHPLMQPNAAVPRFRTCSRTIPQRRRITHPSMSGTATSSTICLPCRSSSRTCSSQ